MATGHSVWGMLNAPATGEAMSELILDGAAHRVDLALFPPGRLPPLDPGRGVTRWECARSGVDRNAYVATRLPTRICRCGPSGTQKGWGESRLVFIQNLP